MKDEQQPKEEEKGKETPQEIIDVGFKLPILSPNTSKVVIITLIFLLILCVVFLGFAFGSARVCKQVDGVLDGSYVCHPNYKPEFNPADVNGLYVDTKYIVGDIYGSG